MSELNDAPGVPGIAPTWTSSAKDAVGCSLGPARLWFTIGYGILNEVYWPRVDLPQIRDLGFVVSDGKGFWSEVKRCGKYSLRSLASGTPAYEIVHPHDRYRLTLRISPDPRRDVLACRGRAGEQRAGNAGICPTCPAPRGERKQQPSRHREAQRTNRALGRSGAVFPRTRRRRSGPKGCGAARERRLRWLQRRLAGFCAQRRNDVVISVGRTW